MNQFSIGNRHEHNVLQLYKEADYFSVWQENQDFVCVWKDATIICETNLLFFIREEITTLSVPMLDPVFSANLDSCEVQSEQK